MSLPVQIIAPPRVNPLTYSARNRRRLSGPGLRVFLSIADLWTLTERERRLILGCPPRSTYQRWTRAAREHRDVTLGVDALTRISGIFGIHAALQILHSTEHDGVASLKRPHNAPEFGGHRPLDFITSGPLDAILTVRRFLDAADGRLYMQPYEIDHNFTPCADEDSTNR